MSAKCRFHDQKLVLAPGWRGKLCYLPFYAKWLSSSFFKKVPDPGFGNNQTSILCALALDYHLSWNAPLTN